MTLKEFIRANSEKYILRFEMVIARSNKRAIKEPIYFDELEQMRVMNLEVYESTPGVMITTSIFISPAQYYYVEIIGSERPQA